MGFLTATLSGAWTFLFGTAARTGLVALLIAAVWGWDYSRIKAAEDRGRQDQKIKQVEADETAVQKGREAVEDVRNAPGTASDWLRKYACPECQR